MSDLSFNLTYCYQLLGLKIGATQAEIKMVYRRMAQQYRPDHNFGSQEAEEQFKGISQAYKLLLEPVQRSQPCLLLDISQSVSAPEINECEFAIALNPFFYLFQRI